MSSAKFGQYLEKLREKLILDQGWLMHPKSIHRDASVIPQNSFTLNCNSLAQIILPYLLFSRLQNTKYEHILKIQAIRKYVR